jgi:GT2 family glycosyltransferase
MEPLIVVPYVNPNEIQTLKSAIKWDAPIVFWEDNGRIGSDLAYQTLWNSYSDRDIILLHADMAPMPEDTNNNWYKQLCDYANKFPEAGILGTTLLYPAKDEEGNFYIQHAGGRFENGEAIHYGGGLDLSSGSASRKVESDEGQYDKKVRNVSWVTFGGVYLRRAALTDVGNFDPLYHWTYYRDVDYCLSARSLGWKIYQTPVKLLHFEGKDNKRIQSENPAKRDKWRINHNIFIEKWKDSDLIKSIDEIVYEEDKESDSYQSTKKSTKSVKKT